MKLKFAINFFLLVLLFSGGSSAFAEDLAVLEAQKVFKQYVDLERAYDPAQAELYAPNASIKDTRLYQDGQSKTLTWTGDSYKQIIKAQLPVAKSRNEQYSYQQTSFTHEGNNVRLKCVRVSSTKKYSAPLEIVFAAGPKPGTPWKIVEESCQSQP